MRQYETAVAPSRRGVIQWKTTGVRGMRLTIRRKLFLSYIVLAILPSVLLGIYLSGTLRDEAVRRALADQARSVEMIADNVKASLTVPVGLSDLLYINLNFFNLIDTQYETAWDAVQSYFLFKDFEGMQKVYGNQIEDIRIYVDNDTILESWYLSKLGEGAKQSDWYKAALSNPRRVVWMPTVNERSFLAKQRYSMVRLIESSKKTKSVVLIDVNTAYTASRLRNAPFEITIMDEAGHVLCTNSAEHAALSAASYGFDAYPFRDAPAVYDSQGDAKSAKLILTDMDVGGVGGRFRVASRVLLEDITGESNALFVRYLALTGLCLLLVSVMVFFFSHNLRNRVELLRSEMDQVSKGDFNMVSKLRGTDEVGVLAQSLNVMAENLKQLVEQNYEQDVQRQYLLAKHNAIKLKQLQNQMNPHFLFNTLESLRMEARIAGQLEIADIIRRLGVLLRKSFRAGSEELPLSEELSMVEDYLRIQTFRHGDKIRYRIDVPDELAQLRALPFLIQPIVENAIIHGLEHSEAGGEIRISAEEAENVLSLSVIDDGVGMSPERLAQIARSLDDDPEDDLHIGIRNVHLRIRIRYGAPYGLTIDNPPGHGTRVRITIPKVP